MTMDEYVREIDRLNAAFKVAVKAAAGNQRLINDALAARHHGMIDAGRLLLRPRDKETNR